MTRVKLETSAGDITLELNTEAAPETTQNFFELCRKRSLCRYYFPSRD